MGVNGLYGLSGSGLDIESMVKVGMMSKQNEYDKMQQKMTKQTWQKEAYNTVYSDLTTFNYSTLSQYKMQSTMDAKGATSTNTGVATVTANGAAAAMSHTIEVESMASNAYLLTGDEKITRNSGAAGTSIYLKDVFDTTGMTSDDKLEFTINDGENKAKVSISYSQIFSDNQTLYDLASAINSARTTGGDKLNLTASYDANNDAFAIYNNVGGAANKIEISVGNERTGELFNRLNLYTVTQGLDDDGTVTSDLGTKVDFSATGIDAAQSEVDSRQADLTNAQNVLAEKQAALATAQEAETAAIQAYDDLDAKIAQYNEWKTLADRWSTDVCPASTKGQYTYSIQRPAWIADALNELGITDTMTYTNTNEGMRWDLDNALTQQISTTIQQRLVGDGTSENPGLYQQRTDAETAKNDAADAVTAASDGVTAANDGVTAAAAALATAQTDYDTAFAAYQNQTQGASGTDGTVKIDGRTYTTDTNKVVASNVTYTIVGKGKSTVTVTQDTDAIVDKVKSFVEDYNKLLDGLYDKYMEQRYSDYKPLTDAQKDDMKDEQIEKWEKKAKSGLLYHDATIGKILDGMREALGTPVDGLAGKYSSAYAIGIDTSKTNGHIKLDEDKLRQALAEEPSCVYEIFGSLPEADADGNYDYDSMGIAQRLGDVMTSSMREVKQYAGETSEMADGSDLGNLMMELQTKMSNFKTMMTAFENNLYKKYDAMEVTLSKLGAQMNFIVGTQQY